MIAALFSLMATAGEEAVVAVDPATPPAATVSAEAKIDPTTTTTLEPAPEWLPVWTIQIDPLTTFLGFEHVQIERALGCSGTAYVGPHLRLFSPPTGPEEPFVGLGVEVGGRWFPWARAPTGAWLGARAVGSYLFTLDESADPALGGYASILAGYTWVFADHYVLSGGAGVQYFHYKVGDYGVEGVFPALHTAVGFAF